MAKKQSEKKTETYLVNQVKLRKGLCLKLVTIHFMGLPDRLVLLPKGRLFFVETKSEGDKPRPIQKYTHDLIRNLGFDVYVLDTKEAINKVLIDYDTSKKC